MPEPGDRRATVVGRGVAALTVARLLRRSGWDVESGGGPARAVPTLLLGSQAVELLESIWGSLDLAHHPLRGRVVRWGAGPAATTGDGGLVLDGAELSAALARRDACAPAVVAGEPRRVVVGVGRPASSTRRLGRRVVLNARVALRPGTDEGLGCMETVTGGWLFLIPAGDGLGVLQAMVPVQPHDPAAGLDRMLAEAREVAQRVSHVAGDPITTFAAAPQLRAPLAWSTGIAVGDAACAFDPVAGDGTGQAVRGAVLATAALESVACGMPEEDALGHYDHRVRLSFLRHLVHCLRYYEAAFAGAPAWWAELATLRRELADPANRALAARPFTHRLAGGTLVPRSPEPDFQPLDLRPPPARSEGW